MADIYFSESTGTILGDGSAATPYKYLRQAELQATSGDTLINLDTCHYGVDGTLSLTYQGGVFDGSISLKNGDTWMTNDEDHWFQADVAAWVENAHTYVSSGMLVGAACAYNDGALLGRMRGNIHVPNNARVRLRYIVKNSVGATSRVEVRDVGSLDYFDFATGTWVASGQTHYNIGSTGGEWVEGVTDWIEARDLTSTDVPSGGMQFDVVTLAGGEVWIQFLGYEFESQWQQHEDDVYRCPLQSIAAAEETYCIWIGEPRDLRYKASSLAAIEPGQFWFVRGIAAGSSQLYYRLADGEDTTLFDAPIYAQRRNAMILDSGTNTVQLCDITGFNQCITTTTGTTRTYSVNCYDNYLYNFRVTSTGSQSNYQPTARRTQGNQAAGGSDHPKGFFISDTAAGLGSMYCQGAISEDIYDDHFQTTGGDLTVEGFVCRGSQNGSGLSLHTGAIAGDLVARHGTIYHEHNTVGAIRDQNDNAGNKLTLQGVVVVCAPGVTNAMEYGTATQAADLTDSTDDNFYNGTANAAYADYFTQLASVAAFGFESTDTLVPGPDSPLLGVGSKWWTGARPTSSSGEPYPDFDIDAGGVQSTHGPFHPSNL